MKILVTGGTGMVGRNLKAIMPDAIYIGTEQFNFAYQADCRRAITHYQPDVIVHLAAVVSGIQYNIARPAKHFDDNALMNINLLQAARKLGVKKFITTLSTCIFPDQLEEHRYPMTEEDMHAGAPAPSNFAYGYAKRMMAVQIDAYKKEFEREKLQYSYLIPSNLYGPHDKMDDRKSHFVGALLKKIAQAHVKGYDHIKLMGDGSPLRQFMYAPDMARVIKDCIDKDIYQNMCVAPPENLSIHEIALTAIRATGNAGLRIIFDKTSPNGQYRKDVSNKKMLELLPGFEYTSLFDGLSSTYKFLTQHVLH